MRRLPVVLVVLAVLAVSALVLVPGTARADGVESLPKEEREAFGFVRMDFFTGGRSGDRLIGVGSRERFQLLEANFDLDIARFPWERLGFELHIPFSATALAASRGGVGNNGTKGGLYVAFHGLVDVGVIKWGGAAPGGLVLGVGGGLDAGDRLWFVDKVRLFVETLARARYWLTTDWHLQAAWTFLPTTSSEWRVREHVFELEGGWKALSFGARLGLTSTVAGAPERTYRDLSLGAFVGATLF